MVYLFLLLCLVWLVRCIVVVGGCFVFSGIVLVCRVGISWKNWFVVFMVFVVGSGGCGLG